MGNVKSGLQDFYQNNLSIENELAQAYTCNNVKLLEVVMEHLLFHWDDIVDLLVDDLIEDEVKERNNIERLLQGDDLEESPAVEMVPRVVQTKEQVDMRDIMRVFDDYNRIAQSIANRL